MILTLEQIKSITVGALKVWDEEGVIHFAKCTPKQVDAWYKLDEVLGFRAETTTGVWVLLWKCFRQSRFQQIVRS